MNVVSIYIPDEAGIDYSSSSYYYGGSNRKGGIIKDFILENTANAIVLSDNNPGPNTSRVIKIAITDYFVIVIDSDSQNNARYGRVYCSVKGINNEPDPAGAKIFQDGYLYFYENNDFFGFGKLFTSTIMINKQRKLLFYGGSNLYRFYNQIISYDGGRGLFTTLSSSNKARLIQPSIKTEGEPMSQYLFSITSQELSAFGINNVPANEMLLLRDEDNNIWGLLNTLLFK